jgi:hypothetical protein
MAESVVDESRAEVAGTQLDVGVGTQDDVGSGFDQGLGQRFLERVGAVVTLGSPMEIDDDGV